MATERRIRIGDWLVPYDDADKEIVVERNLADILRGKPGDDLECMNSRCIRAQRNAHVFPHPVYVVSTIETRVYVIDKLDDAGIPAHAIRYELSERDSRLIKAFDKHGAGEPGELRLRIPIDPKGSPKRAASRAARYADTNGGKRYAGDGKERLGRRPVTAHSLGARRRFVAAAGALAEK